MARRINIISGKGGSGKTSLTLAFAAVLAKSNLRVLVVDCDMSTHGATFFAKSYIEEYKSQKKELLTVDDILNSDASPTYGFLKAIEDNEKKYEFENLIKIENDFYFIPSDISIASEPKIKKNNFPIFLSFVNEELDALFDVIIFDCQAGYSDFTRSVMSVSHISLLISEPDAVSAAANCTLCFQMGVEYNNIKTYQIFNKITDDEAEYYTKVATSAFFVNLQPVLFDWKLRKTFAFLEIPCYETVGLEFVKKISSILCVLLPEYKSAIKQYIKEVLHLNKKAEEAELELLTQKNKRQRRIELLGSMAISAVVIVLTMLLALNIVILENYYKNMIIIMITMIIIIMSVIFYLFQTNYKKRINDKKKKQEEALFVQTKLRDYIMDLKQDDVSETDTLS